MSSTLASPVVLGSDWSDRRKMIATTRVVQGWLLLP